MSLDGFLYDVLRRIPDATAEECYSGQENSAGTIIGFEIRGCLRRG